MKKKTVPYDKHYKKANYFGNPYPEFIEYFKYFEPKGKVLDLGCGQGRDTIALARIGFSVIGVDISQTGLNQIQNIIDREGLDVKIVNSDIYHFKIPDEIDIILLDSMLHFFEKDKDREIGLLKRIIYEVKSGVIVCILINKSVKSESILNLVFKDINDRIKILKDSYIEYPDFNSIYRMVTLEIV